MPLYCIKVPRSYKILAMWPLGAAGGADCRIWSSSLAYSYGDWVGKAKGFT
jgi:hypothetical protein